MREDQNGNEIIRVIEVSYPCRGAFYINSENGGPLDFLRCAFMKDRDCSPKCVAIHEKSEGRVICQRDGGITIGHLKGKFKERTEEEKERYTDYPGP